MHIYAFITHFLQIEPSPSPDPLPNQTVRSPPPPFTWLLSALPTNNVLFALDDLEQVISFHTSKSHRGTLLLGPEDFYRHSTGKPLNFHDGKGT